MSRWSEVDVKYSEPSEEYYNEELLKLDKMLDSFCELSNISKSDVKVNIKSLRQVIKRVDMRGLYFQVFHEGMNANEYKIVVGLTVFWLLKLKPFWLDVNPDGDIDEELLKFAATINEKYALHLVLSLLTEYNADFIEKGEDLVTAYYDELEYSFRYRDLSKESLFLMFNPFYYLYFFNSSVNGEGKLKL